MSEDIFKNNNTPDKLEKSLKNNRVPHAIVLESKKQDFLNEYIKKICKWAVCSEEKRPCNFCIQCRKVEKGNHPDIYTAELSGKTEVVNVEEVRKICSDAYIKPNESRMKVYIIPNADKMQIQAQNAMLKIIEEPPQDILFIFCCTTSQKLLGTILSRVVVYNLDYTYSNDDNSKKSYETALDIAKNLTKTKGYDLLCSISVLNNREYAKSVIEQLIDIIGNAIKHITAETPCNDIEELICDNIETSNLLDITEILYIAIERLNSNINMNLFSTWLCSELRRKK